MTKQYISVQSFLVAIFLMLSVMDSYASEKGQSIMFDNKSDMESADSISTSHTPLEILQNTDDRCAQLLKEIHALQGKPQRRYAKQQEFDAECRPQISDK